MTEYRGRRINAQEGDFDEDIEGDLQYTPEHIVGEVTYAAAYWLEPQIASRDGGAHVDPKTLAIKLPGIPNFAALNHTGIGGDVLNIGIGTSEIVVLVNGCVKLLDIYQGANYFNKYSEGKFIKIFDGYVDLLEFIENMNGA